jgi:hypothetical protein
MYSDELRNLATVVGATVALLVFIVNSSLAVRNRRIENLSRFIDAHQRLFDNDGYIYANLALFDKNALVRDRSTPAMEAKFHLMLIDIEHLAILANNRAVPRYTQVYMFGWYARQILNILTQDERDNVSWELAIGYLEDLTKDAEKYTELTRAQRERFWR